MSALRRCLKRPEPYLAVALIALALAGLDTMRAPGSQVVAGMYVRSVEAYQRHGRGVSRMILQCRYRPTCSEYSRLAVRKYGLLAGLRLTLSRLASCRSQIAPGTEDPVP